MPVTWQASALPSNGPGAREVRGRGERRRDARHVNMSMTAVILKRNAYGSVDFAKYISTTMFSIRPAVPTSRVLQPRVVRKFESSSLSRDGFTRSHESAATDMSLRIGIYCVIGDNRSSVYYVSMLYGVCADPSVTS